MNVQENTPTASIEAATGIPNIPDIPDTPDTPDTHEQRVRRKNGRGMISRWLLALFFIVAGAMHFISPQAYMSVMPPWLGWHAALVLISGIAECAGGIGVLWRPTRRYAGWGLLALCVAVLPANVQMLVDAVAQDRAAWIIMLLVLRLPLQLLLMRWVWLAAQLAAEPEGGSPR